MEMLLNATIKAGQLGHFILNSRLPHPSLTYSSHFDPNPFHSVEVAKISRQVLGRNFAESSVSFPVHRHGVRGAESRESPNVH
jgi:hypothetical protein